MKLPKRARPIVLLLVVGLAVWLGVRARSGRLPNALLSGTVEATEAQLGFTVTGRLDSVAVREGEPVPAGVQIAWLDRSERLARREQAQAQVAAARALLAELERGARPEELAQARAARDVARDRMHDAERDLSRVRELHAGGAVSQEAFDKASIAVDMARNQLAQAEEALGMVATGPRQERIAAQSATVAQAEAALREIEAALENMVLRSAFDGLVTVRHREPGEIVPTGSPVVTVQNRDDRWVRIYVPEVRIGTVHPGQRAAISCDSYPGKTYGGQVTYIASEAEFTPKNVQTTEERVKLVYAVKVRIDADPTYDLKPGMPADVRLEPGTGTSGASR